MEKRAENSRPPPRRWGDGPFRFGQEGRERRIGWMEWAQGWRLAEDDRRQRCAGLVGSWARMGGQFNGLLNTTPATAGLCWAYCVRTASVLCRVDGQSGCCLRRADGRQMVGQSGSARPRTGGNSGRLCDCSGRQRGSAQGFRGQFGKGNSGAGAFSVVRLRGEVSRRSGRFRWGSLYGKGGWVAEKRWGSRRKG